MIAPVEYVTTDRGEIHIVDNASADRTLCDRSVGQNWMLGDATMSGAMSTCADCRQAARVLLRWPAETVGATERRPNHDQCGLCVAEVEHGEPAHRAAVAAFQRHLRVEEV